MIVYLYLFYIYISIYICMHYSFFFFILDAFKQFLQLFLSLLNFTNTFHTPQEAKFQITVNLYRGITAHPFFQAGTKISVFIDCFISWNTIDNIQIEVIRYLHTLPHFFYYFFFIQTKMNN